MPRRTLYSHAALRTGRLDPWHRITAAYPLGMGSPANPTGAPMAFDENTSRRMATLASRILRDPNASEDARSLAACVLTQAPDHDATAVVRNALATKVPRRMTIAEALVFGLEPHDPIRDWARSVVDSMPRNAMARMGDVLGAAEPRNAMAAHRTIAGGGTD
jgi:hypothetical protein